MSNNPGNPDLALSAQRTGSLYAPFLRAPEASRNIFWVIFVAACGPLAAGVVFFGPRALAVAALSVLGAVATESFYYRVTRTPALLGRSHAVLTGLLLALTLPPFVPWYVPLVAAVFAILVGKALFGGVGHFLWQPALVGRLAVTVLFAPPLMSHSLLDRPAWPVLAQNRIILGDVEQVDASVKYRRWRGTMSGADALARPRPRELLRQLTQPVEDPPDSIVTTLRHMPPAWDLVCGAYGGGIGETCAAVIIVAGLYLVYRHYVRGHLPGMFILAAAVTAAIAPVRIGEGDQWLWLPVAAEGLEVGFIYVSYHLLSGEILLAAFFLATEMTSRPVTASGQMIFGVLCGAGAILLRLYLSFPIPTYATVLIVNTFTPLLDGLVRPRVFGQRRWWRLRRRDRKRG
ncbi:hypothetical protein LCGC14_2025120 [marine sediment metagenome]|uniref:Electron transport complex protein RnfD n=1 Tax=marine sediment metagenome TaxID=412755 RepID=A0A0F9H9Q5_9ZZZZ